MRAEGVAVVAVAAFGVSFVAGMEIGSGPAPPAKAPVAAAESLTLATTEALPELAVKAAEPEKQRKPKPRPKKKPKPKPTVKRVARTPAPAPAPVVQVAPAPPPPGPVATPAPPPARTPAPVRTRTPSPAPTFDDGGEPNSGEFENGGTP